MEEPIIMQRFNKLSTKQDILYQSILKKLAIHHFQVKAVIQDILACRESMEALSHLNETGRSKIADLREEIDNLELFAREMSDERIFIEVEAQKHQLASTLKAFKEANMVSLFGVEKAQREELLHPSGSDNSAVRNRKKVDKSGLVDMSTGVTQQLVSMSQQLADTAMRSQHTLDSLVSSSSSVQTTQLELQNTAGSISQSGKLLQKYGRREFTDKLIMLFAFLFFVAVVFYIVQKRLF